jgi:hypothetical protein
LYFLVNPSCLPSPLSQQLPLSDPSAISKNHSDPITLHGIDEGVDDGMDDGLNDDCIDAGIDGEGELRCEMLWARNRRKVEYAGAKKMAFVMMASMERAS